MLCDSWVQICTNGTVLSTLRRKTRAHGKGSWINWISLGIIEIQYILYHDDDSTNMISSSAVSILWFAFFLERLLTPDPK